VTAPPPTDTLLGRTLGEFVLREKIGAGGFGAVYRADQPALGREAVVKLLHPRLRGSASITDRFLREARLASQFDHPYAAHVYAFGSEPDGELWIAMELVRGTPLDQLLRIQGPMSLERFVPLFERICEVVQTAHDQGIVHRDLKPANVMVLSRAGRLLPKLLDFGIAKGVAVEDGGAAPALALGSQPPLDGDSVATLRGGLGAAADHGELAAEAPAPPGLATVLLSRVAPLPPELASLTPRSLGAGSLTEHDTVMGSPPYMAPEQWMDAKAVDRRTDVYALGVLAYEVLTGRLPFRGKTLTDIATAHAQQPLPALGRGLPPALDRVLAKAMAKAPDDRYPEALALGAELRDAAGLGGGDPATLPMMDALRRDAALASAPQPLAEAVAGLQAARNPHQARDALFLLTRTAIRYLGLVAIACRSRISDDDEPAAIAEALRTLSRRPLSDAEWLDLTRGLTAAWSERREAYPVPELVEALHDPARRAGGVLDELLGLQDASASGGDPAALLALLSRGAAKVSALLGELAFLSHYPLVVSLGDGVAERWMGVRRGQRTAVTVQGVAPEPGVTALLDPDGVPILTLSPLFQVVAPAPGVPVELFLFDGRSRRGARMVALPLGFEHHDDALWDWFRAQLRGSLDDGEAATAEERPPYRGLSAFSIDDGGLFVGREKLVDGVINRLRLLPLLTVVGRSGAGKSSFVLAGVAPGLPAGWRTVVVRPGAAPLAVLEARLVHAGIAAAGVAAGIAADPASLGARLRADAEVAGPILLVIDQLEELFTLCQDQEERETFVAGLALAARTADDPVRVVLTLRDDFLVRAEQLAALRNRLGPSLQLLSVPQRGDLLRILIEPARRAGYEFEDAALPEEMVAEVAEQPGALALLSFTAAKLWELRDRHFKQLTRAAYRSLGGVGGALARHAEQTLSEMLPEEQRLTREAFRNLVTSQTTRAVLPRRALGQLLGDSRHGEAVIERLIAARLLVASEDDQGAETIEIVHEALLGAWPRLGDWLREDAEGARLRAQLRGAAAQWLERGRPGGLLWRDEALADYERWRARHAVPLTEDETAFAVASVAAAARGRRVRRGLLAAAFVVLAAGLIVLSSLNATKEAARERAATAQGHAERERARAEASERVALAEHARRLFLDGDLFGAASELGAARDAGATGAGLDYLAARVADVFAKQQGALVGHQRMVWGGRYLRDGQTILTWGEDGTTRRWDGRTGAARGVLEQTQGNVFDLDVSPDEALAATAHEDGTVGLLDLRGGGPPRALTGHTANVVQVRFSPDGRRLASTSADNTTRLWDVASGRELARLDEDGMAAAIWFAPDGATLFTVGQALTQWDGRTGAKVRVLDPDASFQRGLAPSADGTLLVSGSGADRLKVWDVARAAVRRELVVALAGDRAGSKFVTATPAFSPDGRWLAAFTSREVGLWEVATGRRVRVLQPPAPPTALAFSATSSRLAVASASGVQLWDPEDGQLVARIPTRQAPGWIGFAPDGATLLLGGALGEVTRWSTANDLPIQRYPALGEAIATVGLSRDGRRVAACGEQGKVRVWDVDQPRAIVDLTAATRCRVILDATGRQLATRDGVGRVSRRLVEDGAPVTVIADEHAGASAVAFDGDQLLVGAATGALVGYDPAGHRTPRPTSGGQPIFRIATTPRGDLATCGLDGVVRIWPAGAATALERSIASACGALALSDDGRMIAVSSNSQLQIHRVDAAAIAAPVTLSGHQDLIVAVMFTPGGLLVSASADATLRVWESDSGRLLEVISMRDEVAGADLAGDVVVAGIDQGVYLWRLPSVSRAGVVGSGSTKR
jgi:serine/threonine protein kinase/WD40 repeat protein